MKLNIENSAFSAERIVRIAKQRGIISGNETLEDAFRRVAKTMIDIDDILEGGRPNEEFKRRLYKAFSNRSIVPGTPILANAGRSLSLGACTVLPVKMKKGKLSRQSFEAASRFALSQGQGTGYDISSFQDPVKVLEEMNEVLLRLDSQLRACNKRPAASIVVLDAEHPRVIEFIQAKREANFDQWRINISVVFRGDKVVVDRHFGKLVDEIALAAHYCGEPGVLFFDRFEEDNPTPFLPYRCTAPCAEVGLVEGEKCHFIYINLDQMASHHVIDWRKLESAVRLSVRALDDALEQSIAIDSSPLVQLKRRIGVGVMGFHSLLIRLGTPYASDNAVTIAQRLSEFITYQAHSESADLAMRRGPFHIWRSSRWTDHQWINRKANQRTGIIPDSAWAKLTNQILEHGIRNASVVAYPPTGTSSELVQVSKAYEPLFTPKRKWAVMTSQPYLLPAVKQFLDAGGDPSSHVIANALEIPSEWHLRMHAAFQSFSDDAGSKTINVANHVTKNEIESIFRSARPMGLKGLTVFRDGCLHERSNVKIQVP